MVKFIEVFDLGMNENILINAEIISMVYGQGKDEGYIVVDGEAFMVKETYEEIKGKINGKTD